MKITRDFLDNQTFGMRSVAFNAQIPVSAGMPKGPNDRDNLIEGVHVNEDGSVRVQFYAPNAVEVYATNGKIMSAMEKSENGIWTGILQYDAPGFKPIQFIVDNTEVISPILPVAYSGNRVVNYVEIPDMEQDFLLCNHVPHGAVTREFYYSSVTQEWESCLVYTPASYNIETERKYPMLYLQHGGGENENSWVYQGKINFILDNLIASGEAQEMIVVMNNGMVRMTNEQGERISDYWALEELLEKDCIPFVEQKYRAMADRKHRAYAGLSMGSLVGGKIIMEHPELFSAAGLFTGFFAPSYDTRQEDFVKVLDDAESFNEAYPIFFRCMGLEEMSMPLFEEESSFLDTKGIRYIAGNYPGGHEWRMWRRCFYEFVKLIFKSE